MKENLITRLLNSTSYMEALGCLTVLGANKILGTLYLQYFTYRMEKSIETDEEVLLQELKTRVVLLTPECIVSEVHTSVTPLKCWKYNMGSGQLTETRATDCAWLFDVFTFVAPDREAAEDYIHVLKLEAQV